MSEVEGSRFIATAVMATLGKQSDSDNHRKNERRHLLSALVRRGTEQEGCDGTGFVVRRSGFVFDFVETSLNSSKIS